MANKTYVNLKLPPEILEGLKALAKAEYMTMIAYVSKHVEEKTKECAK